MSFSSIIDSPRSLEAMVNLGVLATDLDKVSKQDILQKLRERERSDNIPMELVDVRYDAA